MARMLRARATSWRRVTSTYGYEVTGSLRVREERAWRRDWAADEMDAEDERHTLEWMRLRASGRRTLGLIEAQEGPLGVWRS